MFQSRDGSEEIVLTTTGELYRIDTLGNIIIHGVGYSGTMDIKEEKEGGYMMCGGKVVEKLRADGGIEWQRRYDSVVIPGGSSINDWYVINRLSKSLDGSGYKVIGVRGHYDEDEGEYSYMGFLMSIDDTGGFEWIRYYDGWDDEVSMSTVKDGYVVGVQRWFRDSSVIWRAGICKVDTEGNLEWLREYYYLYYFDMKPCEGGYLLSIAGRDDAPYPVLVKTDTLGLVDEIGERINRPSASGFDYIIRSRRELTQLLRGNPAIRIYDLSGREIGLKTYCFKLRRGIYLYEDKRRRGLMLLLMK